MMYACFSSKANLSGVSVFTNMSRNSVDSRKILTEGRFLSPETAKNAFEMGYSSRCCFFVMSSGIYT